MYFERRVHGEDEWHPVSQAVVRVALAKSWTNVDLAMRDLLAGDTIYTASAEYRIGKERG